MPVLLITFIFWRQIWSLAFQHQSGTSNIQHPASSIQHPASSIQHPASSIQHPASSIQHPTSSIILGLEEVEILIIRKTGSKVVGRYRSYNGWQAERKFLSCSLVRQWLDTLWLKRLWQAWCPLPSQTSLTPILMSLTPSLLHSTTSFLPLMFVCNPVKLRALPLLLIWTPWRLTLV